MKPALTWSYRPYSPPLRDAGDPVICRLAPGKNRIRVEWIRPENAAEASPSSPDLFRVCWRERGEGEFRSFADTEDFGFTVEDLEEGRDYEIAVFRIGGEGEPLSRSRVRLARTGEAVGTVVNYLHPEDDAYAFSGRCLCSPCVIRHPDGFLLASMDVYIGGGPQNLSMIFRSDDDGDSWRYLCDLFPCFWGRMFVLGRDVYMLACSTEYGDLLIGKSADGGRTFSAPTVLLRGSCARDCAGVHKNPQPPVICGGRIWTTLEWGSWAVGGHAAMVGSAPQDADLTDAAQWLFSEPLPYDPSWPGTADGPSEGCIEGTLAVFPDGHLYNVMRYEIGRCSPNYGLALVYRVRTDDPEAPLVYEKAVPFPGNHAKFMIRKDPATGMYYSIVDRILGPEHAGDRNLLSLIRSRDCERWETVCDLIDRREEDPRKVGFQYVDFFIEGEDILFLCRTALNGARNFHDANYSTFHRVRKFREL